MALPLLVRQSVVCGKTMDPVHDLLQSLQSCYESSLSSLSPHPRLYKNGPRTSLELQNDRRRERLARQKQKREEQLAVRRERLSTSDITDLVEVWDAEDEVMDTSEGKPRSRSRRNRPYRNMLMLSEWMVQVPERLEQEWLLIVCPVGKRCTVVCSQGQTRCYARNGFEFMSKFASLLPGGNGHARGTSSHNAILDCIFCDKEQTFYILDVILWNGVSFYGCDTDFRMFWLDSHQEDLLPATATSARNKFIFKQLTRHSCSTDVIRRTLTTSHFTAEVDGYLFMHKECCYVAGVTPLVSWLKQDMVHDALLVDEHKVEA